MSILAQPPSHRGQIAELFVRDAATVLLRSAQSCYALYALNTTSLFSNSQPWHFYHASATFLAF